MFTSLTFKFFAPLAALSMLWMFLLQATPSVGQTAPPVLPEEPLFVQDDAGPERVQGSAMILDARVDYSASDTIYHDIRNRRVYIFGNGVLTYGEIHLTADHIEIDFNTNELRAKGVPDSLGVIQGRPVFSDGMQSFESDELRYNFETKRGRTLGVITEESEGFVHGDVVKIQPTREVHVSDGKFTTCDDPEPHFHIAFRQAKIIPNDKIITSVAYLVIQGIPTPLLVPFGYFPNKRGQASGVLIPSYGESRNRGFYLENGGFYWGINEYVDLSIRGDIYSRGSWALRTGSNYSLRYRYSGSLNLTYAINVLGERNLPNYERSRDFRVVWNHSQDAKAHPNRTFRASVNAGSSQSSRFNPVSEEDYLSNTFSSNVSYNRNWSGRYNFSANLRHSQNTNTRRVDLSLPEITFGVSRFHPFRSQRPSGPSRWYEDISITYNMNARNELSIVDTLLFSQEALQSFRNGIRHSIPINHTTRVLRHFNMSTSINYQENWYWSTTRREWDDEAGNAVLDTVPGFRVARDFSVSSGLSTRLYGMMQFQSGPVSALRHVVSPSISFSFRPDFADPFWGYYESYYDPVQDREVVYSVFERGLYGGPSSGRSGNIGLSVSNNLEMKVRNRKEPGAEDRKIVLIDNLTLSTGYDLARDSLNLADLRLNGRTRLLGNFDITYAASWTPYARDEQGRIFDRYVWQDGNKLLQRSNTTWSLNLNYSLSSSDESGQGVGAQGGLPQNGVTPASNGRVTQESGPMERVVQETLPAAGPNYEVPWNLSFSYSFRYNSRFVYISDEFDRNHVQSLSVRGDVFLTPKWRIGFHSGYDFQQKEITYTSIDIFRDLHCWEMTFNWIPFGFRQSYNFTIRVKASVLQDLKLTRRTHHMDRAFQ